MMMVNCEHIITTRPLDIATTETFCSKCSYIFGHSVDYSIKSKQCDDNGHKWTISGIWKHNPHLWCSNCGWYLEQNKIKKEGLTEVFFKALVMNNPEGYYLSDWDI